MVQLAFMLFAYAVNHLVLIHAPNFNLLGTCMAQDQPTVGSNTSKPVPLRLPMFRLLPYHLVNSLHPQ